MDRVIVILYSHEGSSPSQTRNRQVWIDQLAEIPGVEVYLTVRTNEDTSRLQGTKIIPLKLDVEDRYDQLPLKTYSMLRSFSGRSDYRYLVKVDDDVVLFPAQFIKTLRSLDPGRRPYLGYRIVRDDNPKRLGTHHIGRCDPGCRVNQIPASYEFLKTTPLVYADGPLYALSSRYVTLLAANLTPAEIANNQALADARGIYEDVMVGEKLQALGVYPSADFVLSRWLSGGWITNLLQLPLTLIFDKSVWKFCGIYRAKNGVPTWLESRALILWRLLFQAKQDLAPGVVSSQTSTDSSSSSKTAEGESPRIRRVK